MVIGAEAPAWKRPAAEPVTEQEPDPAPVTPEESAYRTRHAAA